MLLWFGLASVSIVGRSGHRLHGSGNITALLCPFPEALLVFDPRRDSGDFFITP